MLLMASGLVATARKTENQIRVYDARISVVFKMVRRRSAAFHDLVVSLEQLDRVVFIDRGRCRHGGMRACLLVLPAPGAATLVVKVDPRQSIGSILGQLAHELYHASEIVRSPDVRNPATARDFFFRVGGRICGNDSDDCWETKAAVAFERLVRHQFDSAVAVPPAEQALFEGASSAGFRTH
jgi:hypothetical protein